MRHGNLNRMVWLAWLFCTSPVLATTNVVSGEITAHTAWSGTNLLLGTVLVRSNAVVTVAPGTLLLMSTAAVLRVEGQLLAEGTSQQPIRFTRSTTSGSWGRLLFVRAADSRLRHCVIEFANSAGEHQDYYDNDCDSGTPPLPRTYHEAIVALATHLELDHCLFQNLPSNSGARDGDALAIIADDPEITGPASAIVRHCEFRSIGQGVHTRFAYVLVEGCVFSDKHGDNDDIDLYGESTPPPLIRNNVFLPGHEDKINPTRCSAIIVGNLVIGSDDHGIVLRDRGSPVVANNLILDCASAGISVQNQCDALIANNTIVNSRRGVRFFDHFDRHGPPYCLSPGSGRATIVNCVLWDCDDSLVLTDSPDGHSYAEVAHCNIQGGSSSASVSANSTLVWGPGNISLDPQFANPGTNNFRLLAGSPCIDAGTNVLAFAARFAFALTNDFDGLPRPLAGDRNGHPQADLGAHEFLEPAADSNDDGIPDGWTLAHGFNPIDPGVAASNPDGDPHTTLEEWTADTDPRDPFSHFRLTVPEEELAFRVGFLSSSNRNYTLQRAAQFESGPAFTDVTGQTGVPGNGATMTLTDANAAAGAFYRVEVRVP